MKRLLLVITGSVVSLAAATGVVIAQTGDQPVLEPNVWTSGVIDPDSLQADAYFDGVAGSVVQWGVESSLTEGYIDLDDVLIFSPDGEEFARITFYYPSAYSPQYRLTQTGRYHIALQAKNPGTYDLLVKVRETQRFEDDTYFFEDVLYESTVGYLDYYFAASTGETIRTYANARTFDAILTLYGPDGAVLATDDDSLGDLNPVIGPVTLEQAGDYRLVVTSYTSGDGGNFHVYLQRNPTRPPNEIVFGQPVTVTLDSEDRLYRFWLEGSDGDVVDLVIDDPDGIAGVRVESSVDSGRILVSTVESPYRMYTDLHNFVLPRDGRYSLVIEAHDDTAAGTVQVQLDRTGQHSLNGPPRTTSIHVSEKDPVRRFHFMGYSRTVASVSISQAAYEADTRPFRMTFYDGAGKILDQIVVSDLVGSYMLDQTLTVGLVNGEITLELELIGEGPAWFDLSVELISGEG